MRESGSGLPLAATVTAAVFSTVTDPATGYYSLMVPPGSYTVTATAEDYAPASVDGVEAVASQTVRVDFDLDPICAVFADDVESGNQGWAADSPWAITDESSHSPSHSWTDSPGGNYSNLRDDALVSPPFDLSAVSGTTLGFWHIYDLEPGYDFGYLETSTDGGGTWSTVRAFNGWNQTTWTAEEVALSQLDGQGEVRLRFRLETDVSVTGDGWHLDDVVLAGGSPGCARPAPIFADDFESGDLSAWSSVVP